MEVAAPLVLPVDVQLIPVAGLSESLRLRVGGEEGDYAISRPGSRSGSKLIDAKAAGFLEQFRSPATIVDAAIRFARQTASDPEEVLEDAFPLVMHLVQSRYLVQADSAERSGIIPTIAAGDKLAGGDVVSCVHVTEDTEVYELWMPEGRKVAAKVLRPGFELSLTATLEHELRILRLLNGSPAPRVIASGVSDGRPYLLTEWCGGTDASALATHLRESRDGRSNSDFLNLAVAIVESYEQLHRRGVVHGDVNPRNLLVGPDDKVVILDFGLACSDDHPAHTPPRGGWSYLYEPEAADDFLRGGRGPRVTRAGEQYSLGALLFQLFTGSWYLDFKASSEEMYRQIVEQAPASFEDRAAEPWPEVEAALARCLSKDPADRFRSLTDLRMELERIRDNATGSAPPAAKVAIPGRQDARRKQLVSALADRYRVDGRLLRADVLPNPTVSVAYGRAGIAHGLYRMACANDSPKLIAEADAWCVSAKARSGSPGAFTNDEIGVTDELVGRVSTLFGPPGPQVVQALIGDAMGSWDSVRQAVALFVELCAEPGDNLDMTLGRASVLNSAALLLEATDGENRAKLKSFGDSWLANLWETLETHGPVGETSPVTYLGIAHGWAGILYATLQWCRSSKIALPANLTRRLNELASCAEPIGKGLRWPSERFAGQVPRSRNFMSGWCHGTAGYTVLWLLAHWMLNDDRFLELAEGAARYTWEDSESYPSLCCGLAGRAYALLDFYAHSGSPVWLDRASALADRAVDGLRAIPADMKDSLFKGELGVATLLADLNRPESARFPFFQVQS